MQVNRLSNMLIVLLASVLPVTAFAHHPNDYQLPNSLTEGLLSGFGHPVIGLDHLAFIIGMGVLSYFLGKRASLPLIFVGGTLIGAVIHLNSINIPLSETLIAVSVVLLGLVLIMRAFKLPVLAWFAPFACAGILHGYAYGESIIGAEATPLAAYLIGFALIQLTISMLAAFICQWLENSKIIPANLLARCYGSIAVATGAFFML